MSIKKAKQAVGWDTAIADAKKKIDKLQTIITICEEKKAAGEPWPGNEKAEKADGPFRLNAGTPAEFGGTRQEYYEVLWMGCQRFTGVSSPFSHCE